MKTSEKFQVLVKKPICEFDAMRAGLISDLWRECSGIVLRADKLAQHRQELIHEIYASVMESIQANVSRDAA